MTMPLFNGRPSDYAVQSFSMEPSPEQQKLDVAEHLDLRTELALLRRLIAGVSNLPAISAKLDYKCTR